MSLGTRFRDLEYCLKEDSIIVYEYNSIAYICPCNNTYIPKRYQTRTPQVQSAFGLFNS